MKLIYQFNGERVRTVCSDCGSNVQKSITKENKEYLSNGSRSSIHGGTFATAHRCDLWVAQGLIEAGYQSREIARGEVISGATVKVIKGRKVPVGSIAKIFWIGDSDYGFSVGLILENGEKTFTALKNIETIVKVGA